MTAGSSLQAAVAQALSTIGEFSGVYDGPPTRAPYPYVVIDTANETDWSHKSGEGREVLVALTIWDEQPIRLRELADATELKARQLTGVEGHQLVSLRFMRRRIIRDVAGPWAAAIDFRARLLAAG
jgi:hypothetical protein